MAYLINRCQLDHLNLRLKWALKHERPSGWELVWHAKYTVVWFIVQGERNILIDNRHIRVHSGELIALKPNQLIRIFGEDQPFAFYALAFEAKIEKIDVSVMYRFPNFVEKHQLDHTETLIHLWEKLIEQSIPLSKVLTTGEEESSIVLKIDETLLYLQIHQKLYHWFAEFYRLVLPLLPLSPIQFDDRIHHICQYIHSHNEQRITLKQLSDTFHISPGHLSLLFKNSTGYSPMAYVRMARINGSRDMLERTSCTVREISERFNFQNQSEFSRVFRQYVGMTPTNYRKTFKHSMKEFTDGQSIK